MKIKFKKPNLKSFNLKKLFNMFKALNLRRSLRMRLVVILMLMAIIPLVSMGIFVSNYAKEVLTSEVHEKGRIMIKNIDDSIKIFIEQKSSLIQFLASTDIVRSMDQDDIADFLTNVTASDSQLSRIYIANADGEFFTVPYNIASSGDSNVKNEEWFQEIFNSKLNRKVLISNPKKDSLADRLIVNISAPIISTTSDEIIGVLSAEVPLTTFSIMFMNMNIGREGDAYITDSKGYIIAHSDPIVGASHINFGDYDFVNEALAGNTGFGTFNIDNENALVAYGIQGETKWGIFVQQPESEAYAPVANVAKSILSTGISIALISLLIGILFGNFIAIPITKLVKVSKSVAEGNLQENVNIKDTTEIGTLAASFNQMVESLRQLVQEVVKAAENISASSEELAAGSEQSSQSSQQVAKAVEQIAAGASEQVQKLTDISEMIQKLVEVNGMMEEKARLSADSAEQMAADATRSQEKMNVTTEKMQAIKSSMERSYTIMEELNDKVGEIGNISTLIKEIVDQTNLLALNASIEAARAGEHGRGFAVVADEVRKLAEQSGEAAKQIAEIVKQIQKSSKFAVDAMAESDKQVDEGQSLITETNDNINDIMKQFQSVAQNAKETMEEIASQNKKLENILEMAQNISVISQETAAGTEEVSASAQEQTATMESIESSAQELARLAENLTSLVNKFDI